MRVICCCFFFFFKQKTAYEVRISDGSSDVCSSDLRVGGQALGHFGAGLRRAGLGRAGAFGHDGLTGGDQQRGGCEQNPPGAFHGSEQVRLPGGIRLCHLASLWKLVLLIRSVTRRVGKVCDSQWKSRWAAYHETKKK